MPHQVMVDPQAPIGCDSANEEPVSFSWTNEIGLGTLFRWLHTGSSFVSKSRSINRSPAFFVAKNPGIVVTFQCQKRFL